MTNEKTKIKESAIETCTFYIATYLAGGYEIVDTRTLSTSEKGTRNYVKDMPTHRIVKVRLVEVKE